MTEETRKRGPRYGGSVHQRPDGRWVTQVSYPTPRGAPRKRRSLYSKTEEEARAKLADLLEREPELTSRPRHLQMFEARQLGKHRPEAWEEVLDASQGVCAYCHTPVGIESLTKDHRIPMSRGGSDSLENLAPCCLPCNSSKADLTDVEFISHRVVGPEHLTATETLRQHLVVFHGAATDAWTDRTMGELRDRHAERHEYFMGGSIVHPLEDLSHELERP